MTEKDLGRVVATAGIDREMKKDSRFNIFVSECLFTRYLEEDWGELCEEDKAMNDSAIKNGDDRIFASYKIPEELSDVGEKIYIITEWDRSVTTILFPSEY